MYLKHVIALKSGPSPNLYWEIQHKTYAQRGSVKIDEGTVSHKCGLILGNVAKTTS